MKPEEHFGLKQLTTVTLAGYTGLDDMGSSIDYDVWQLFDPPPLNYINFNPFPRTISSDIMVFVLNYMPLSRARDILLIKGEVL